MPGNSHAFPEFLWRNFANLACVVAFLLMHAVLAPLTLFMGVVPLLLACVIGYGLMQEVQVSVWLIVVLGLVHDTATGLPLGLTALQLLVLRWGLTRHITAIEDEGFMTRYLWFTLGLAACFAVQYVAMSFIMHQLMPLSSVLVPFVVTLLIYPIVHLVLLMVQRRLYRRIWVFLPPEYKPVK